MRTALVRSLLAFPGVAVLLAACWHEPLNFVDSPHPGAPAYWESGISAEGAAPRARDAGTDADEEADAETSDAFLRERAADGGPAPPSAQTPGGSVPEEPLGVGRDDASGI